ncbi:hypothetical protein FQN54_009782 [Arachnomyces sp. PD_36]|nr:hypothetical protein FQN54_009782 [Arachnomyces sp. PD_36]
MGSVLSMVFHRNGRTSLNNDLEMNPRNQPTGNRTTGQTTPKVRAMDVFAWILFLTLGILILLVPVTLVMAVVHDFKKDKAD